MMSFRATVIRITTAATSITAMSILAVSAVSAQRLDAPIEKRVEANADGAESQKRVETIADTLLNIFGLDQSHKMYVADRPGHDRRYLLDSTKIRAELGWEPRTPFEAGFKETALWYKESSWWWKPLMKKLQVDEEAWK